MKNKAISQLLIDERERTQLKLSDVVETSGVSNVKQIEEGSNVSIMRLFKIFDVYTTPVEVIHQALKDDINQLSNADRLRLENELMIRGINLEGEYIGSEPIPFRVLMYKYRMLNNWSFDMLSEELDMSNKFLMNLEIKNTPSAKMIYTLSDVLNIPSHEVLKSIEGMTHLKQEKHDELIEYFTKQADKEESQMYEDVIEDENESEDSEDVDSTDESNIDESHEDPHESSVIDLFNNDLTYKTQPLNNVKKSGRHKQKDMVQIVAQEHDDILKYHILDDENIENFISQWKAIIENPGDLFIHFIIDDGSEMYLNVTSIIAVKIFKVRFDYV